MNYPILLVVVSACAGVLTGLALAAVSLARGLAARPRLVTPQEHREERVRARPVPVGKIGPDTAWPVYPFRQMGADISAVWTDGGGLYQRMWRWPREAFFAGRHGPLLVWWFFFPIPVATIIFLLATGLGMVMANGLFTGVTLVCAAAVAVPNVVACAALRGAEGGWRKVMRAEASCPRCYHVTARPAYRCPGCGLLHRDIRPSTLGLIMRRCECGRRLPTMVVRAAWRLEAVCQRCAEPLRPGSAAVRDVRIPVFGDVSAGKTRFLYAALDSLMAATGRAGVPFGFLDETGEQQARLGLKVIQSGRDTVKTPATLPTALTCRIGSGPGTTHMHLFDAAGEHFRGWQTHDQLGFLHYGQGLVYVLDPFSIGAVRDRMTGQHAVALRLARAAAGDPEIAYGEVVSRLRDSGVKPGSQRLAVVVSKADLLTAGGVDLPAGSDAIAQWLTGVGLHNLVLSARREFERVRYFAVASLSAEESSGPRDPGAPLSWLLRSWGVRLPADPLAEATVEAQS